MEHVAAALTLPDHDLEELRAQKEVHTPPRSPIKEYSPQRLAETVTVCAPSPRSHERADVESIRIYADIDVYALLVDVENEINRMSEGVDATPISAIDSAVSMSEPLPKPFNEKTEAPQLQDERKASVESIEQAVQEEEFTLSARCFQPSNRTLTT